MIDHVGIALDFTSLGLDPIVGSIPAFDLFGLTLGPLSLRWYSLAYIAGILGGWWYLGRLLRASDPPMTQEHADAFITWATLGIILGGRIGYVLFYDFDQFSGNPLAILRLWDGGMAFHGGLIGMTLAMLGFARANKLDFLRVCDYVACVVPIGQMFGRLANFVNGELFGRPTGSDWGIIFPDGGPLARHPSQLYEAAGEGLLLLVVLAYLFWRTPARRYPGMLAGVFVFGFGAVRFGIEYFREPDAQLGLLALGLTMGQWLCVPMIALGLYLIVSSRGRAERLGRLQAA